MALGSLTQKSSNPQLTHFVRRVLKSDTPVYVSVETGRIAVSASGLPPCFTLKTIASPARIWRDNLDETAAAIRLAAAADSDGKIVAIRSASKAFLIVADAAL